MTEFEDLLNFIWG